MQLQIIYADVILCILQNFPDQYFHRTLLGIYTALKVFAFGVILVHFFPHFHFEFGKMRTRITPKTDSFRAVLLLVFAIIFHNISSSPFTVKWLSIVWINEHRSFFNCRLQAEYFSVRQGINIPSKFALSLKAFFFKSGFSFTNIHELQDCRGRGRTFL